MTLPRCCPRPRRPPPASTPTASRPRPQNLRALAAAGLRPDRGPQPQPRHDRRRRHRRADRRGEARRAQADHQRSARRAPPRRPPTAPRTPRSTSGRSTTPSPATTRSSTPSSTTRLVADYPGLVAQRVVGTTYGGRDIVALQVTKDATGADIAGRPAVLYNAMQHAREWLAGETCRRTLDYFVDNYGKGTSAGLEVTQLVDTTELWFVCVNNPDGYEYTFTPGNRLWRKNLRDNDANGVDHDRRRRRPEPQLLLELGPRQRRLLARPGVRDLPRPVARLRARDEGDGGAVRRDPPGLPEERPHRGAAAALPAGLPAGHAERRRRDLHRARRRPVQARHRGLPARAVGGPLHHQRRLHRLGVQHHRTRSRSRPRAPRPRTRT